ncbi:BTB/POZ protein, partial [Xylogone sp. PMI_703]
FHNSKYSDVTVYLGESKIPFPAHQLVLGISSPYFEDALTSDFKEGKTKEFTFEKDSPHALWRVFQYMYTEDYADEASEVLGSEGDDLELLRHPQVYALADMFRMENLKILSCQKFEQQLQQHWISDTLV